MMGRSVGLKKREQHTFIDLSVILVGFFSAASLQAYGPELLNRVGRTKKNKKQHTFIDLGVF